MTSSVVNGANTVIINDGQFAINNAIGDPDFAQRLFLDNIAVKALHDANNTGFDLPKCYPGTREAVIRDLFDWVTEPGGPTRYPIYWLYAPAGSGKTAIAKTFADYCSNGDKHQLLASFFFRRTALYQNNEERFIATLAHQIMTRIPQTSRFLIDAIKANHAIFQLDLQLQANKLILEPLANAFKAATPTERGLWPRLVVIDGLDECVGQDAQQKVLDVISLLGQRRSPALSIYFSSRPEPQVWRAFQEGRLCSLSLKVYLPHFYRATHDIRYFVKRRFQEVMKAHRRILLFHPDWPGDQVIDKLVQKSSGQFIYASVVMEYIAVLDDNPMERLNMVLGLEKIPDNENPLAQLDALYSGILDSVKPKFLPTVTRVLQVTLAQYWVEFDDNIVHRFECPHYRPSRDPLQWLPSIDLTSFLHLQQGQLAYGISNLDGIVIRTSDRTPRVTFLHESFSDFLLDKNRSGKYHIDIGLAHAELTVNLSKYILHTHDLQPNDAGIFVSILVHLHLATRTAELGQVLREMDEPQIARRIVHNCTTRRFQFMHGGSGLCGWAVLFAFASVFGSSPFRDGSTSVNAFRIAVKDYVSVALEKYKDEPLSHFITLFLTARSFPRNNAPYGGLKRTVVSTSSRYSARNSASKYPSSYGSPNPKADPSPSVYSDPPGTSNNYPASSVYSDPYGASNYSSGPSLSVYSDPYGASNHKADPSSSFFYSKHNLGSSKPLYPIPHSLFATSGATSNPSQRFDPSASNSHYANRGKIYIDGFYAFLWTRFNLTGAVQQTDRDALNLQSLVMEGYLITDTQEQNPIEVKRRFLRELVEEIGYTVTPDIYAATCICALKCVDDLSTPSVSKSSPRNHRGLAAGLKLIEYHLAQGNVPKAYVPGTRVRALSCLLHNIIGPLLERAGPSQELLSYLNRHEQTIFLLSHLDENGLKLTLQRRESIKNVVDRYIMEAVEPNGSKSSSQHVEEGNAVIGILRWLIWNVSHGG